MWVVRIGGLAVLWGCRPPPDVVAVDLIAIGEVPPHPNTGGGDVGVSALLGGRSVWAFGDTLFPEPAADGLTWRSATWASTADLEGADGLDGFVHAMGDDGAPIQLLPLTPEELEFALGHPGHRLVPWPGSAIGDGQRAVVLYSDMETGDGGPWDFAAVGASVATWADPDQPASRVVPPLFGPDEPHPVAGAALHEGWLYAFAYGWPHGPGCGVARVRWGEETDRAAWRFWDGTGWGEDPQALVSVFNGAPTVGVQYLPFADRFVAVYMPPASERIVLRTARAPEGPWSRPVTVGRGEPAEHGFDYALVSHPELAFDDARTLILSYSRPSGFLAYETRLLALTLDLVAPR